MKPLLSKTTRPFIIYVLIVLGISVPVYYFVVDAIWRSELDEHNRIIADKTAYELNHLNLSDTQLQNSIALWNDIQPGTKIKSIKPDDDLKDKVYTIDKQKSHTKPKHVNRFRCLSTVITINKNQYRFTVKTNIEETRETITAIATITIFFFIILVAGLLLLTRKLSKTVWRPFHHTLKRLKAFNLNNHAKIEFNKTDIKEFEELNQSLNRLIEQNVSVYKTQKEFTENASHELQTPLAILKNKMDVLLQSDDLTEKQYHIVEQMNRALTRSAHINKNLLLLAKIENRQFDNAELTGFDTVLVQSLDTLQEHFREKDIHVDTHIDPGTEVKSNSSLTEVLVNNLLTNAIRYTAPGGSVRVLLSTSGLTIANSGKEALPPGLLFKRFSKMAAGNTGSGLGLSIVQEICRLYGWSIGYRFESSKHTFTVTF